MTHMYLKLRLKKRFRKMSHFWNKLFCIYAWWCSVRLIIFDGKFSVDLFDKKVVEIFRISMYLPVSSKFDVAYWKVIEVFLSYFINVDKIKSYGWKTDRRSIIK